MCYKFELNPAVCNCKPYHLYDTHTHECTDAHTRTHTHTHTHLGSPLQDDFFIKDIFIVEGLHNVSSKRQQLRMFFADNDLVGSQQSLLSLWIVNNKLTTQKKKSTAVNITYVGLQHKITQYTHQLRQPARK